MQIGDIPDTEVPLADPETLIRQYTPLVRKLAQRYRSVLSYTAAIDEEDLIQSGLFAIAETQKQYEPGRGCSFLSFVFTAIRRAMIQTLRTGTTPETVISLETPVKEAEGLTLSDTIPDNTPTAEENIVSQDGQQEIVDSVRGAVDRLKNQKHREAVTRIWFDGQDKQSAAAEMGISVTALRSLDLNARYKLRRDKQLKMLAYPLYHVGVTTFNSTMTSAVEMAVLWRERQFNQQFGIGAYTEKQNSDDQNDNMLTAGQFSDHVDRQQLSEQPAEAQQQSVISDPQEAGNVPPVLPGDLSSH